MLTFIVPIILAASYVQPWTNLPCEPQLTITETSTGLFWKEESLGAYYSKSQQKIYLCPQILQDRELARHSYIHEMAHHIYFTKLTEKQREYWRQLGWGYVSEYAKKDEVEDFADTFSYVYRKKAVISEPKKLFIQSILLSL